MKNIHKKFQIQRAKITIESEKIQLQIEITKKDNRLIELNRIRKHNTNNNKEHFDIRLPRRVQNGFLEISIDSSVYHRIASTR